jgi:hypothetical protein
MPMFHSTKCKDSMLLLHLKSPSLNLLVWFVLSLVICCKTEFYELIHNVMIRWRTDMIYNAEQYCLTWSILQINESENNTNIENFKHIVIEDLNNRCHEKIIYCLSLQIAILSTIFTHLIEKHVMWYMYSINQTVFWLIYYQWSFMLLPSICIAAVVVLIVW